LIPSNSHRDDHFGYAVDLAGDTASVVSFSSLSSGGAAFIFTVQNATLLSNPSGRGFSISGCGVNGNFTTPFTGFLANCTITWNSPDTTIPHTRYTFQNWADGEASNPRAFSLPIESINYTFTANFLTEYELTAQSSPVSGGSVSGAGWYTAGTTAGVAAIPNPGFTFAGFTGGLTGAVNPQGIAMNGPQNATGSFAATPPAALSAVVSAKSGAANGRLWTISLTNGGPGTAYTAQLFLLQFTQTFGTACTTLPVRLSPAALPAALGTLANGATAQAAVALDFTGCPANARFAVNLGYMCNGGASGGIIQLVNQLP
jgi:hypothetical protein